MLLATLILLAEGAEKAADTAKDSGGGSPLTGMIPIFLMVLVGYFLLFRPMRQQEKTRQAMVSAMKKNDRVVTSGGIIGIVANIKDDEVSLKIDEGSNVRLKVTKASIVKVLNSSSTEETSKDKEES